MTGRKPQPPASDDESLSGLHLVEPAPSYLRYLCYAWIALSAVYLVYLVIISMLYFFSPEGDFDHRMLPNPPLGRTWLLILTLAAGSAFRLAASLAIVRGDRGQTSARIGWLVLLVSTTANLLDAFLPQSRLTVITDVSATPVVVAVLAGLTLVALLWPGTLAWTWSKGEEVVPYATYYTELMAESEIRKLKSGEADIRLPSVHDDADGRYDGGGVNRADNSGGR